MLTEPYASCPCGSGKKYKWCCQAISPLVEKAFALSQSGQHEAALHAMEALVRAHDRNPQAWSYMAQFLAAHGRVEEADAALEKAFAIDPNHAFALKLRGLIREQEGEHVGALMLYRRAVNAYHPSAKEELADLYDRIAENELIQNHPIAGRAAMKQAVRLIPGEEMFRQRLSVLFDNPGRLPRTARKEFQTRRPDPDLPADQAAAWKQALARLSPDAKFTDQVQLFEKLTAQCSNDSNAWFNLGLAQAWLGENEKAIEALDRSAELDRDEDRASQTVILAQILRCGRGLEEHSDYVIHAFNFQIRDPRELTQSLGQWERERRLIAARADEQTGALSALLLTEPSGLVVTGGSQRARLGAHMLIVAGLVRLWHVNQETLEGIAREFQHRAGMSLGESRITVEPVHFEEVTSEAMAFPTQPSSADQVRQAMAKESEHFFEEVWPNRALKALGGLTPKDVAGSPTLRRKLRGLIQFLEECMDMGYGVDPGHPETLERRVYDFNRLRRQLSLLDDGAGASAEGAGDKAIAEMSAEELAALSEDVSDGRLEEGFRRAVQLGNRDLADTLARRAIERPIGDRPDRFSFFSHLAQSSQNAGQWDEAATLLERGEQVDQESNGGKRRNDYALRRGQVLSKKGDTEAAHSVFASLLDSEPEDPKYYVAATEAMLGRHAGYAQEFAEKGLALARKLNSRDAEGHFLELLEAAKR